MPLRIAVIGAGTAGLASAILLARDQHQVDLFETLKEPLPIGSGILLQPQGLYALNQLGLLPDILQVGSRVDALLGHSHHNRRVMDFKYADLHADLYGVGIHRGQLFQVLWSASKQAQVNIYCGQTITTLQQSQTVSLQSSQQSFDDYDLVIIADGTWSQLREQIGIPYKQKIYPWGALWSIWPDATQQAGAVLDQKYRRSDTMIGLLPTGKPPQQSDHSVSFFWSLQASQYQHWSEQPFEQWRDHVFRLWPRVEDFWPADSRFEDFTFARYGDVVMPHWHQGKVVIIGDAAHAMSPQLGQGANMALTDALHLSEQIALNQNVEQALAQYSLHRRKHIRYYQQASRMLTPFFQSNSRMLAWLRDLMFPPMKHIPLAKKHALSTLAGVKPSLLRHKSIYDLSTITEILNKPR